MWGISDGVMADGDRDEIVAVFDREDDAYLMAIDGLFTVVPIPRNPKTWEEAMERRYGVDIGHD